MMTRLCLIFMLLQRDFHLPPWSPAYNTDRSSLIIRFEVFATHILLYLELEDNGEGGSGNEVSFLYAKEFAYLWL